MITWEDVAQELNGLTRAMNQIKVACESLSKTWQDLIDWINEKD